MASGTFRIQSCTLVLAMAAVAIFCKTASAFAPDFSVSPDRRDARSLWASNKDGSDTGYPALSEARVRKLLDAVPVYAVAEGNKDGIVLLNEKENPNSIAYFFFSPDLANEVYAPLRAQRADDAAWEVTAFPLGLIWFDLLKNPIGSEGIRGKFIADGIEYRLVPNPSELEGARNIIEQSVQKHGNNENPDIFKKDYNEIPLFVDDFLRVQGKGGEAKIPLYLGLQDLLETCQQAVEANSKDKNSEKYQAAVNLADLRTIIGQMQQQSPTNFQESILIPPSSSSATSRITKAEQEVKDIELPMATNDLWAD